MEYTKTNWQNSPSTSTPINATNLNKIEDQLEALTNAIYPIGSIYISVNNVNPSTLFGGTWEQIKDTFLLCAGDTYSAGATGGATAHNHSLTNGYALIGYDWYSSGNQSKIVIQSKTHNFVGNTYTHGDIGQYDSGSLNASFPAALDGTTDNASNMPPYLAVYVWKRVADPNEE